MRWNIVHQKKYTSCCCFFIAEFDVQKFYKGLGRYNGLKKLPGNQYKDFELILCVYKDKIVHIEQ